VNDVYKWYNFDTLGFEFDLEKSRSNMKKHGIDFVDAQGLWEDPERLIEPARIIDEPRYMIVGMLGDKHWSAFFTHRDDRIRIISVRRSRRKEISLYEDQSEGSR